MMEVTRVDVNSITPAEFRSRYMDKNLPVILTGGCRTWRACREWVADGKPDLARLEGLFGAYMYAHKTLFVACVR